jgi:hypothetical protein
MREAAHRIDDVGDASCPFLGAVDGVGGSLGEAELEAGVDVGGTLAFFDVIAGISLERAVRGDADIDVAATAGIGGAAPFVDAVRWHALATCEISSVAGAACETAVVTMGLTTATPVIAPALEVSSGLGAHGSVAWRVATGLVWQWSDVEIAAGVIADLAPTASATLTASVQGEWDLLESPSSP